LFPNNQQPSSMSQQVPGKNFESIISKIKSWLCDIMLPSYETRGTTLIFNQLFLLFVEMH